MIIHGVVRLIERAGELPRSASSHFTVCVNMVQYSTLQYGIHYSGAVYYSRDIRIIVQHEHYLDDHSISVAVNLWV